MSDTDPAESFDRFIWIQDFAAHLANLGAPGPMRVLMKLGEDQFDAGERRPSGGRPSGLGSLANAAIRPTWASN